MRLTLAAAFALALAACTPAPATDASETPSYAFTLPHGADN